MNNKNLIKRAIAVFIAVILIGFALSLLKRTTFGTDPFSGTETIRGMRKPYNRNLNQLYYPYISIKNTVQGYTSFLFLD
ncbi:hypothetical protein P4646_27275 [Peribacillus simplex]|uniref:hypothetical protein n=1 Tax=Peribacillus simplex TaxID=1478 RepID=UPI002E238662|nr:hypothetical protein [Peribacillus simplex]MED4094351.1 hypothetical protein [Peribacillus simplex]